MNKPHPPGDRWSVPISAIEHYGYCPRQAVLIWQESYFESNLDTVRGDLAHEAVDRGGTLTGRAGARIWRSLPVHSDALGVHGVCDTVHRSRDGLIPVEHKSGRYTPADLPTCKWPLKCCVCVRCSTGLSRTVSYSPAKTGAAT
ncbi:CRISPR-associated protein Cas4 [Nocardia alni]|uniref:CRISPR-associated protein Cas4 n=1 Tax=Nocardia alni TaxID=2815723 RepID=UPI001C239DAF|nr:Dna2/Cas4 domain-containing protein [Nocardia alni]